MDLVKQVLKPRSYDAAKKIAGGELSGAALMLQATTVRGLLIMPALRFVDIPWKQAAYGAFLGSATISLGLVAFYLIDRND